MKDDDSDRPGLDPLEIRYYPAGPTVQAFHASDAPRRLLMGPVGSGKSVGGCYEGMRRGFQMPVCIDGNRRARCAIVRNTFGDLERTTIKTWCDQFGEAYGRPVKRSAGIIHEIKRKLSDGSSIDLEFMFFSLDRPDDVKRLLSLELSHAFVNESREIPKPIFEALDDRIGRFPSKQMLPPGVMPFFGWWGDSNPPDKDHWIYETFEVDRPEGWELFRQPGGLIWDGYKWVANPEAENLHNLTAGDKYYTGKVPGKSEDHIRVYYGAKYGYVKEGRLVIGDFSEHLHASPSVLEFDENIELIYVGLDFGATPAASMLQLGHGGQWRAIREIQSDKTGMHSFAADQLKPALLDLAARGHKFVITGDPSGGGDTEDAPFRVLAKHGINCQPAYTNAFEKRMEVLRGLCRELVDGQPKFLLSHACKTTRRGLAQRFVYKRLGIDTEEGQKYQIKPDKNEFSHTIDAMIYGIMGSGEGSNMGGSGEKQGPLGYRRLH